MNKAIVEEVQAKGAVTGWTNGGIALAVLLILLRGTTKFTVYVPA